MDYGIKSAIEVVCIGKVIKKRLWLIERNKGKNNAKILRIYHLKKYTQIQRWAIDWITLRILSL